LHDFHYPGAPVQTGMRTRFALLSTALAGAVLAAAACGSSGGDNTFGGGGAGGSAAGGIGGGPIGPGAGGSILGGGGGISGTGASTGSGASTGTGGGFDECAAVAEEAEGQHLDMYVLLDHTGSMGNDCPLNLATPPPANGSKWCFATNALGRYFTSAQAMGHRAALQFLAVQGFACAGGPGNAEASPVVAMTLLPVAAASPMITTLDAADAAGGFGTPIEAGLRGIATFTAGNVTPGRTMIGILITDGDPNGCDGNITNLAAVADAHFKATGIRTFIIGMTGATLTNLEPIAVAGGAAAHTDFCGNGVASCHYWSVGNGDPSAFVASLQAIAGQAVLPCQYTIPPPPAGTEFDPGLVNVSFTDAAGAESKLFHVASEAACDGAMGGWFYDAMPPTAVRLCKASCDVVTAAGAGSKVHVAFGCQTMEPPVR
jgi:hypothetical protein